MAKPHIVILGAGISGLSLAWFIKQTLDDQAEISVIEKNKEAGGCIQTIRHEGFLFEKGPRSCRPQGAGLDTLSLIHQLKLQDQIITASPDARHRFIWKNQQLQKLPSSFTDLFSPLGKVLLNALIQDWKTPRYKGGREESIREFSERRFGKSFAENFLEPLVLGIYAGNDELLSLKACFNKFYEMENTSGSLLKNWLGNRLKKKKPLDPLQKLASPLFSLKNGMQSLPSAIAEQLRESTFFNTAVRQLKFKGQKIDVHLDAQILEADYVVSALPCVEYAKLMQERSIIEALESIPGSTVDVISMGFRSKILPEEGFGYLVPSCAQEDILGMVWDSSVFPQQNQRPDETRITCMIGGVRRKDLMMQPLERSVEIALKALKKHLKVKSSPCAIYSHRAYEAIPQYQIGHLSKIEALEKFQKNICHRLFFLGNSYYGVSVNDCIHQAKKLANHLCFSILNHHAELI